MNTTFCFVSNEMGFRSSTRDYSAALDAAKEIASFTNKPVYIDHYWNDNACGRTQISPDGFITQMLNEQGKTRWSISQSEAKGIEGKGEALLAKPQLLKSCEQELSDHLTRMMLYMRSAPVENEKVEGEIYKHCIMAQMVDVLRGDTWQEGAEEYHFEQQVVDEKTAMCILGYSNQEMNCLEFLYECYMNSDLGIQDVIEESLSGVYQAFGFEKEEPSHKPSFHSILEKAEQRSGGSSNKSSVSMNKEPEHS